MSFGPPWQKKRGSSSLPPTPLTSDQALELGVAIYNSQAGEDSLYRLLEAVPRPEWVRALEVHGGLPPVLFESRRRVGLKAGERTGGKGEGSARRGLQPWWRS